jgi:hypothetical protein
MIKKKTQKKRPAKAAKRKRALPKAARVIVPPALCAHPRLVHGFLVRAPAIPNGLAASARKISIDATPANERASIRGDVLHEGPTDDATFH